MKLKEIGFSILVGIAVELLCRVIFDTSILSLQIPLWSWLLITIGIIFVHDIIYYLIKRHHVKEIINEFTECSFGDSFVYTWNYKRTKDGRYSAYGYEATNIRTKIPLAEMNNETVHTCGHEVPENTIKLFIQLIMIASIDKKMTKQLKPVLEYLNWVEDSQKHQLLH